jgi:cysteine-rich repeat protein
VVLQSAQGQGAACPKLEEEQICNGIPLCADCGDGLVVGEEECDDGNLEPNDGCSTTCTVESAAGWSCVGSNSTQSRCYKCGDGIQQALEDCDDGGQQSGDGCSAQCEVETGYVCANANGVAPSVCQSQEEYKRTIIETLQENEQRCNHEEVWKTFVASDPVTGAGECALPPPAQFESSMQRVETRTSLSGAPLTISPVAVTQMSATLNPMSSLAIDMPPTLLKSKLDPAVVCRSTQTVVCGVTVQPKDSLHHSTFCVEHTASKCVEVCVDSSEGCDVQAGGREVVRPFGNYLSQPGQALCCYSDCNIPEQWGIKSAPHQWCQQVQRDDSLDIEQKAPLKPDDEASVVSFDESNVLPEKMPTAPVQSNHTETVGPFDFTIFVDDSGLKQTAIAQANCLVDRVEHCETDLTGKRTCQTSSKASCLSVFGPESLCTESSGGELHKHGERVTCEFKGCQTPQDWVTANDVPVTKDSWCYVQNIQRAASMRTSIAAPDLAIVNSNDIKMSEVHSLDEFN